MLGAGRMSIEQVAQAIGDARDLTRLWPLLDQWTRDFDDGLAKRLQRGEGRSLYNAKHLAQVLPR